VGGSAKKKEKRCLSQVIGKRKNGGLKRAQTRRKEIKQYRGEKENRSQDGTKGAS